MKLDYLQFQELEIFTRFGSRLEASVEAKIRRGRLLRELLKQERLSRWRRNSTWPGWWPTTRDCSTACTAITCRDWRPCFQLADRRPAALVFEPENWRDGCGRLARRAGAMSRRRELSRRLGALGYFRHHVCHARPGADGDHILQDFLLPQQDGGQYRSGSRRLPRLAC